MFELGLQQSQLSQESCAYGKVYLNNILNKHILNYNIQGLVLFARATLSILSN